MADGHIKISSRIDNSKAEKDFKDLENMIDEFGGKSEARLRSDLAQSEKHFDNLTKGIEKNLEAMEELGKEIDVLEAKRIENAAKGYTLDIETDQIEELFNQMDQLDEETASWEVELLKVDATLERIGNTLETNAIKAEQAAQAEVQAQTELAQSMYQTELQAQGIAVAVDDITYGTKQWSDELNNNVKYGYTDLKNNVRVTAELQKEVTEETKETVKEAEKLNKVSKGGIGKIGRYAMALFGIRSVYGMLSKLSNQWLNSNTEAANATKAQIESMSNMLANTLAPVMQFLVNLAAQLMGYFAALLKVLFGIDITTKKASKNTGGMAKGAKATNKELKRMLTGFDEVEKLSSDTADNMAGGGGGGGGIDEISVPEPNTGKFEEAINRMKDMLLSIWNTDTMQSFFDSFSRIGSAAFESIKTLANTMWDNVVLSWEEASPFIFEGLENLVEYWRRVFEDIADVTEKWLPSITDKLAKFIDDIFATFRPLTTFIAQLWRDFTQIMLDLWNEYGAEILDKIGEFIDNSVGLFNKVWTHIIDPIISPAIQFLTDIWNDHLKDLVMEIGRFIGDLVKFALDISNKFIAPAASLFLDVLQPAVSVAFSTMFGVIKGVLGGMLDFIKITISSIRGVFNGLITFITGVFTGNWRKAWQGVKDIFGSIVGGLGKMFIIPINIIIDSLNGFIRGLNKIKIPKWVPGVGGKGIDIQPIQRLQRGTVVNRPMPAMLGDGGAEAVIPLENDTRALEHIAGLLNSFNDTGQGGDIIVQIGNETVFKMMISELKKRQTQMNGGVVLGI